MSVRWPPNDQATYLGCRVFQALTYREPAVTCNAGRRRDRNLAGRQGVYQWGTPCFWTRSAMLTLVRETFISSATFPADRLFSS